MVVRRDASLMLGVILLFILQTANSFSHDYHCASQAKLFKNVPHSPAKGNILFNTKIKTRSKPAITSRVEMIPSAIASSAIGHVIAGAAAVPIVGSATTSWYKRINLPSWTPPNRIFGPVWTILYSLMGVAFARVMTQSSLSRVFINRVAALWGCHMVLNLSWAPIFFGAKKLRLGAIINVLLTISLFFIIPFYYSTDPLSGILLLPYLVWLVFATALNIEICKLNPTDKYGYNKAKFESGLMDLQRKAAAYANGQ